MQTWLDIATHFKKLVPEVQRETSVRWFYVYKAMLDREFTKRHRDDFNFAQLAMEIRRLRETVFALKTEGSNFGDDLTTEQFLIDLVIGIKKKKDDDDEDEYFNSQEEADEYVKQQERYWSALTGAKVVN